MAEPADLFSSLNSRFRTLDKTRGQIERLVGEGQLSRRASEQMYESLFLSAFTSFEVFVEDLFLTLLVQTSTSRQRRTLPRVEVRSFAVARELLIGPGPKKYVDWLPVRNTIDRAELFFRGGRPFTVLSSQSRQSIDRAQVIRHAIAHRSRHSQQRFEREVIAGAPLAPRERTPAAFLRGAMAVNPPLTRYEHFSLGLLSAAKAVSDAA